MSSTRDFVAATVADTLLPVLRRPVEDVIYETIDRRQIPTRTDFTEIRDLVNSLRGQLTGATGGVKRLAETADELDERLEQLEEKVAALAGGADVTAVVEAAIDARLSALTAALEARIDARLAAGPAAPTPVRQTVAAARVCKVDGCNGKVRAKGFCAKHYQQWRRGTLAGFPPPT